MKSWLFSLHKGVGNSPQFFTNVFNGEAWSGDVPMPGNTWISNTPAAVVFNTNLYVFYPINQSLYYRVYDGELWTAAAQVPNMAGVGGGVAAAVYDGLIYLLYSNPGQSDLMYKTYDGTSFGPEINTSGTNHLISVAYQNVDTPVAVVRGDTLYVFGRGPGYSEPGNMNRFWYATFDRSTWRSNPVAGTERSGRSFLQGLDLPVLQRPHGSLLLQAVRRHWQLGSRPPGPRHAGQFRQCRAGRVQRHIVRPAPGA
ncbi:hypothetical protein [Bradyrhizobium sp. USDA 4520]